MYVCMYVCVFLEACSKKLVQVSSKLLISLIYLGTHGVTYSPAPQELFFFLVSEVKKGREMVAAAVLIRNNTLTHKG